MSIHAPEFPLGLDWVGAPRPLTLAELRGQAVVLDFWTYCCINCMHLIPVLKRLEERRSQDPLVVIGVHSAKFAAEDDPLRIREAMARYGITHPVVVDRGHQIRRGYTVRSWPTLAVIRPDGTVAGLFPGETDLDALDSIVGRVLDEARQDGSLASKPFRLESIADEPSGWLAFPGKVCALSDERVAVADSGQHRVLVLSVDGDVEAVIGSGREGFSDGSSGEARFRNPQGVAFDAEAACLFVADTGNHALREVHLRSGQVRTLAGNGELGRRSPRTAVPGRTASLRSPWDIALAGDYVLVAMAGAHQIWAIHRAHESIGVLAGSGREALVDGTFAEAAFAQPSGLSLAGGRLYLADSESSAVRYLDLTRGEVHTLVGTGLFDFGDEDGPPERARLQHPIGISAGPAGLLVADTYNDKIKALDTETGEVRTWFAGTPGISLREPGGLCQREDGTVIVADTNHHRLVQISADGRSAREVALRGAMPGIVPEASGEREEVRVLKATALAPGDATLRLRLVPSEGLALADRSHVSLRITASPPLAAPAADQGFEVSGPPRRGVPVLLRNASRDAEGEGLIEIRVEAVVCSHDPAACWPIRATYRLPYRVAATAAGAVEATLPLPDPRVAAPAVDSPRAPA